MRALSNLHTHLHTHTHTCILSFSLRSQNISQMLRRQDKDRRWRQNYKRLEREVNCLEEDEYQLERIYPQVGGKLAGSWGLMERGERVYVRV
jgi:hypothetical protein